MIRTLPLRVAAALTFALALFSSMACSTGIDGPTPTSNAGVAPKVVCNAIDKNGENAKLMTKVVLTSPDGATFSPMPSGVLTDSPKVAVPAVTLKSATLASVPLPRTMLVSTTEIDVTIGSAEKIVAGTYDVVVDNPNGKTGTTVGAVRIVDPPVVDAVAVPTAGGDTICNAIDSTLTITGTGFRPADGDVVEVLDATGKVVLTGAAADVKVVDEKTITLTIRGAAPPNLAPGTYGIRVTGTEGPPACTGTKQGAFKVVPPPTITKIEPITTCTDVDSSFKITGTGFREGLSVLFGTTKPTTVKVVSDTEITVTFVSKTLTAGEYDVTVTNPELGDAGKQCFATSVKAVTVYPPPTITDVKPGSACTDAGQTFIITGTGFRPASTVKVGTINPTKTTVDSETQITVVFDAKTLPLGDYDLTVTIPEGCFATWTKKITVFPPPTLTSVAPTTVCAGGGSTVTATGTNFQGAMIVEVGGTAASDVKVVSATSLTFTAPPLVTSGSPYDVTVKLAEGCGATLTKVLTLATGPRLDSIDAPKGWNGIDNPVTIYGDLFAAGTRIFLRGAGASGADVELTDVVVSSSTLIRATVPSGATAGGPYDLVLTPPSGCGSVLPKAFTVVGAADINLSKIVPPFGWTGEKTPVSIVGTGLQSTPRAYLQIPTLSPKLLPLKSTAFVSSTNINSIVPAGLPVGGPYDLVVINPDGGGGKLAGAFRVVAKPIPTIDTMTPATGTTGTSVAVTITGCNFRSSTVATVDAAGAVLPQTAGTLTCAGASTCPGGTNVCTFAATLNVPANGPYLVRVTNPDESTAGEYASFVGTNPSAKLDGTTFKAAENLVVGRRSLQSVAGRLNSAAKFVYALGGEQADGTALDSVEVGPLDLFGTIGKWYVQRNKFAAPRSGLAAVQQGGYVYVFGGTSGKAATGSPLAGTAGTGTPLDTIERAKILDLSDQPQVADPVPTSVGGLGKGTWYYVVAAVKAATDLDNPSGETLPSDEVIITLGLPGSVKLSWPAVTGATAYRVYRTEKVNGVSSTEVFLKETTSLSYEDTASDAPDLTRTPLRRGSTGVWVPMAGKLARARFNHTATIAPDGTGQLRVYLVGGHGSCTTGGTATTMNCWEMATLSSDGKTLGAFTAGASTMSTPRERHGVDALTKVNGPPGFTGTQSFLVIGGGFGAASSVEYAFVDSTPAAGSLTFKGCTSGPSTCSQFSPSKDGTQLTILGGFAYVFGGSATGAYQNSIKFNGGGPISIGATALASFGSWSDATVSIPTSRGRFGFAIESGYFYLVGGSSTDADALNSVVQLVY